MAVLIGIALKSLLIAGLTLGLLQLIKGRSAAERSWLAHIGLLALVIMALAPLVLPSWNVATPALFGSAPAAEASAVTAAAPTAGAAQPIAPVAQEIVARTKPAKAALSPLALTTALYAVPAAILLLITVLALARLIALRARAEVLVDGHWLTALARAQRRMGFKHGTALLTSNALASPISWGLMRPVILLNSRAVEAQHEAEAIIAHELAHVARMDWVKLLLARVATALFWFNPLVWILAREAHQLREEAADDAVLAADIADTDYAELLVGVARHECPGLLLGAHGVAPSRTSLARRVARVLDGKSVRGPAARSFAAGVFVGAVLVAAPLAALTLTPGGAPKPAPVVKTAAKGGIAPYYQPSEVPTDLPTIIAHGVSTAVTAVKPMSEAEEARAERAADVAEAVANATEARDEALAEARQAVAEARAAKVHVAVGPDRAVRVDVGPGRHPDRDIVDRIIELKASGVTAEYIQAMRAAAPSLRSVDPSEFVGLKAVGATPEWTRAMASVGFRRLDVENLTSARAVGLTGDYVRAMAAAGIPPDVDDYIQLRAVGVPPSYVQSMRRAGINVRNADRVVEMWTMGVKPSDVSVNPSRSDPDG
ncbi:MAG TPA: M56 family metallopeptidase [Sphingomicrobium sp.]|nr:M56 family metallopeptidase [Sphingomicrobium sp.]